ncbi:Uncharacterised protein [Chlamydia trachomatis]|nr:Uncharacterised protein [Chlamydia trachomatis]
MLQKSRLALSEAVNEVVTISKAPPAAEVVLIELEKIWVCVLPEMVQAPSPHEVIFDKVIF